MEKKCQTCKYSRKILLNGYVCKRAPDSPALQSSILVSLRYFNMGRWHEIRKQFPKLIKNCVACHMYERH